MATDVIQSLDVKLLRVGIYDNDDLPTAAEGTIAYDITNHKLMIRVNSAWETITSS